MTLEDPKVEVEPTIAEAFPFYRLSWVDHFIRSIERLPGSSRWIYLVMGLSLLALLSGGAWLEGVFPPGEFLIIHIFFSATFPFFLSMTGYLNQRASSALESMRPALELDEENLHVIRARLTAMPAVPVLLAGVISLGFVFVTEAIGGGPYHPEILEGFQISSKVMRFIYLASWWFFGAFCYHTIYQLRMVNQIYSHHTKINLYRIKSLYSLSNLTAYSAVSLIVAPLGFLLINPTIRMSDPLILVFYVMITCIAIATFLWPQIGITRLQRREKARLLDRANQRYEQLLIEFHRRVDQQEYDEISALSPGFNLVQSEIKTIKQTSTWPWQPETIRWFITALVLPLCLWLIQFLLQRFLGG